MATVGFKGLTYNARIKVSILARFKMSSEWTRKATYSLSYKSDEKLVVYADIVECYG